MLVTHICFPSGDHLPGFACLREVTEGWTLDTTGCGFHLRWGYTGSQALERLIPLAGRTGNQFHDHLWLDTDGSMVRRAWVNPWGKSWPIACILHCHSPAMTLRIWIIRPWYIFTMVVETSVIRVGMKDPALGSGRTSRVFTLPGLERRIGSVRGQGFLASGGISPPTACLWVWRFGDKPFPSSQGS